MQTLSCICRSAGIFSTMNSMGDIWELPCSSFPLRNDYGSTTTLLPSFIPWTRHQDKIFEHALVLVPESTPNRWLEISSLIPGKSAAEVRDHYDALVSDLLKIDSGRVELPSYADESGTNSQERKSPSRFSEKASKSRSSESERKKGTPWTKKEHQLFLLGLKKFGKGDWRSISRNMVITRTPTQVASHAQKYFLRQESSGKKDRKRSSIHDITTVEGSFVAAAATNQSLQCQPSTVPILFQPPTPSLPLPQQFASASYFPYYRSLA